MSEASRTTSPAANDSESPATVSPLSQELVIGLVGFAGSGCSTAAKRLRMVFENYDYKVYTIKLSELIVSQFPAESAPTVVEGIREGVQKLERATFLQNKGDNLREQHGSHAVAALAIQQIRRLRGETDSGAGKLAFIVESIKHSDEVELLRRVYDSSFRLIGVHCERPTRESRLIGERLSTARYSDAPREEVVKFMGRDEKDSGHSFGQQVRDAFYLSDFFVDNNSIAQDGANLTIDLKRFVDLLLGAELVRPTLDERAMSLAYTASRQSSCLSRQVGAVLVSKNGEIVSTGTNEVPTFDGGVYGEGSKNDHRCHVWEFSDGKLKFRGCHNDRKKTDLRGQIGTWLAENFSGDLAKCAHPATGLEMDLAESAREEAATRISAFLSGDEIDLSSMPGVKKLIEYSRAIHAEMGAVLSAARSGISPVGGTLYCTVYPCHNCARHLVTAGIHKVLYVEPYVKSLAAELHSDSIDNVLTKGPQTKMLIVPFTGVGPRMYNDFFGKIDELKDADGSYRRPRASAPTKGVRLRELIKVEEAAASLVPELGNDRQ
jgi:deoxycytidylate deaminase/dephospho-CoA kinase